MRKIPLSEPFPPTTVGNLTNGLLAHEVLGRNVFNKHSRCSFFPNLDDIRLRQLAFPVAIALGDSHPSTSRSLSNIFLLRSNPKVIWICTRSIIATVDHVKTFWNLTDQNPVCGSMRQKQFISDANHSVAVIVPASIPIPASAKSGIFRLVWQRAVLVHFSPKAFLRDQRDRIREIFVSGIHSFIMTVVSCCRSLIAGGNSALNLSIVEGIAT